MKPLIATLALIAACGAFVALSDRVDLALDFTLDRTVSFRAGRAAALAAADRAADAETVEPAQAVFVGDIMLDRGVSRHAQVHGTGSIFAGIADLFRGKDLVIGNHEGAMTHEEPVAVPYGSVLRFTFDPSYATFLKEMGFTAVSLANNHSLDFGNAGFIETKNHLRGAGILTFGSALNTVDRSLRITAEGMDVCLVGYHDLYAPNASSTIAEIARIRPRCAYVIVMPHWGDEYQPLANARQKFLGRKFIDAGADIVFGAHPHVVQPIEIYKGRPIFYSLGNFIFDQDFSFETTHGLAVAVELPHPVDGIVSDMKFELVPIKIQKGEATIAEGENREKILQAVGAEVPAGGVFTVSYVRE